VSSCVLKYVWCTQGVTLSQLTAGYQWMVQEAGSRGRQAVIVYLYIVIVLYNTACLILFNLLYL